MFITVELHSSNLFLIEYIYYRVLEALLFFLAQLFVYDVIFLPVPLEKVFLTMKRDVCENNTFIVLLCFGNIHSSLS